MCRSSSVSYTHLDFQYRHLELKGIKVRPNTTIGKTITIDDLFRDGYKSVFIGAGLWKAVSYTHLDVYKRQGLMWGRILEVLARKAAQGVDVRVMYDGTCEFSTLPRDYPCLLYTSFAGTIDDVFAKAKKG